MPRQVADNMWILTQEMLLYEIKEMIQKIKILQGELKTVANLPEILESSKVSTKRYLEHNGTVVTGIQEPQDTAPTCPSPSPSGLHNTTPRPQKHPTSPNTENSDTGPSNKNCQQKQTNKKGCQKNIISGQKNVISTISSISIGERSQKKFTESDFKGSLESIPPKSASFGLFGGGQIDENPSKSPCFSRSDFGGSQIGDNPSKSPSFSPSQLHAKLRRLKSLRQDRLSPRHDPCRKFLSVPVDRLWSVSALELSLGSRRRRRRRREAVEELRAEFELSQLASRRP
ncbi:hypothetical protein M8J77_014234 [Diaphorina citri]|nr:hypothetical protein M8J77_014234 [Diaphorina citri]